MKKKFLAFVMALAVILSCAAMLAPDAAEAETLYIIPDSNTRLLTWDELYNGYQYDTLLYAYNEILARHGYKFETGSRCYNWFTQMPWYTPNPEENSKNHSKSLNARNKTERENMALIKMVREEMRRVGWYNPKGKGMPTPPTELVDRPRGFDRIDGLQAKQTYPVYTAPSTNAYRAAKGKAAVSTDGLVYALGQDQGWMLIMYDANHTGQYRVGYIQISKMKGKVPALDMLSWDGSTVEVLYDTKLTDDPALTETALTTLPAGTQVTYLSTMYNSGAWDYIETTIDGKRARGFVPSGTLSYTGEDMTEKDDPDYVPGLGDG